MSHSSHSLKVGNVRVGVTKGLGIHHLSVGLYSGLKGSQVVYVYNSVCYALCFKCVGNEVERTTIQVIGSNNVVASLNNVLQSIGYSGSA